MHPGRITRPQIAKIWASARELEMDRDLLYALVPRGSIRGLTRQEASQLIEHLINLGAGPCKVSERTEARRAENARTRATQHQRNFIYFLLGKLGWLENPERARGFLRKYFHVESVEEIADRKKASGVIEALKAIYRRTDKAQKTTAAGL